MRAIFWSTVVVLLSIFFVMGCGSSIKSTSKSDDLPSSMRNMAHNLEVILPYVFSKKEFKDSSNESKISGFMEDYSKSVQRVPSHVGEAYLGKDPLVKYSLKRLQQNAQYALKAFEEGHKEYARNTLKESVTACFNCHSASQFGTEKSFDTSKLASSFRMDPAERADFYVATRQFDKAIGVLESVLQSPVDFYDSPHEQMIALKKYLSLEIRVKKDPVRAASTVETFLNRSKLPYFLDQDAKSWLRSLRNWSGRKQKVENPYGTAKSLLQQAAKNESHTGYQTGLVESLRATALLHEALRTKNSPYRRAQIYQLLGNSYDSLEDLGVWDLPEVYYEACVRLRPKTKVAKSCYKSFERSIVLGFSGSAGIFIPEEERARLTELRGLAGL